MARQGKQLTPRGKALRWMTRHRGLTERPAETNSDDRKDGIRAAQLLCANGGRWLIGQPWCGTWCYNALHAAGVRGLSSRLASVALIEDDARAHRAPFRGWTRDIHKVLRGDLVVLFGRGTHVALVRCIFKRGGIWWVETDEGNTSSGDAGSQDNGGGSYRRMRPLSAVHGFALVNYPNR
jgi:hypothetical protein